MANVGDGVGVTQRVQKVTIAKWVKRLSDLTKRKLVVFAKLEKAGMITGGGSGGQIRWPVETGEHALNPFIDGRPVSFERFESEENAFLDWRGYHLNDFITRQEKLENGGPEAMVKIFDGKSKKIQRNAMRRLNYEIYKDGNAAANVAANAIHGIESFMSTGAQTVGDELATIHDDTYANLSTAIGGLNAEANFTRIWTPVVVSTNKQVAGANVTWEQAGDEYLRLANTKGSYGNGDDENFDLCTLNEDAWLDLLNILDGKERIVVNRGSSVELVSMGFKNSVEVDGLPVTWDRAVPTTDADAVAGSVKGYLWTTKQMELHLLGPGNQIFKVDVTFTSTHQGDEIFVWTLLQMRFESPKYFGKLVDLDAAV